MARQGTFFLAMFGAALLVSSLGCVVGPGSIAAGRGVYNDVINRTEDDQLLDMIVHDRYRQTYGMLAVASVTASINASADVRAQFGLSRSLSEDYATNLVPLAGGVAFEENPTISYVPMAGETFVQRLLNPLSMEEVLLMRQYLPGRPDVYMKVCLRSINGVRNPFVTHGDSGSAAYSRLVQLWVHLKSAGVLRLGRVPSGEFKVLFELADGEHEKELLELLELIGITQRPSGGRLILPVQVAAGRSDEAINYETLSVLTILRAAGACIEIPESHLKAGVVEPAEDKHEGRFMRIHTSRVRPAGEGTVAIQYRSWWYYVDDADPASKEAFLFLRMLVGLRLHKPDRHEAAPVLTIPVGAR